MSDLEVLPARSYLFVPGSKPERFDKACSVGADAVIIDLEDSVGPGHKDMARRTVAEWLFAGHSAYLRINAVGTPWFDEDLQLCAREGVAGIVLSKAECPPDVARVAEIGKCVLPLIETAKGFANAEAIARVHKVERLVFGSIDFQLDLGISGDNDELLPFRSHLVFVSRLADRQAPVDGVTTALHDTSKVQADATRAARLGFGAKLCIHPNQVAVVNTCFSPTEDEVQWAQKICGSSIDGNATSRDGFMIDRPIQLKAARILRAAARRDFRN